MRREQDDDHEVLFALEMALEHDQRHQALALRTWMPRIKKWYAQAQSARVTEGWKLVPMEPTEEMLIAAGTVTGYDHERKTADKDHIAWWKDMLAAAPAHGEKDFQDGGRASGRVTNAVGDPDPSRGPETTSLSPGVGGSGRPAHGEKDK